MTVLGIIRTPTGVLATESDPAWGITLQPGKDPAGTFVPKSALEAISLPEGWTKVPAPLWRAFRDLCFRFLNWESKEVDSAQEVAIILTRSGPNFETWEAWVPTQEVNGGRVDSDLRIPLVNLLTGERFDSLSAIVATGRAHAGSMHSHNTMGAFFSLIDDGSEIGVPGLHCVLGECAKPEGSKHARKNTRITYAIAPSIVWRKKRYEQIVTDQGIRDLEASDVIDVEEMAGRFGSRTFHKNVLTVISKAQPKPYTLADDSDWNPATWGHNTVKPTAVLGILGVYPASVDPTKCWVMRENTLGTILVDIASLPEYWQRVANAKNACKAATQDAPSDTAGTARLGLFRKGYATTIPQAAYLAFMVERTLQEPEAPKETWIAMLRLLRDLGFTYTPKAQCHTEAAPAGSSAVPGE